MLSGNRIVAATLFAGMLSAMGAEAQPIMLTDGKDESKVAVVKWAAMGSGCRAAEEQPAKDRNVGLRVVSGNAVGRSPLLLELRMDRFDLQGGRRIERDHLADFYSECALRFAIRGQRGMRVRKIESRVKLEVHKETGSSLLLFNELKFGQFGGDEKRMEYDEPAEIKGRVIDLLLSKELASVRSDGQSSCGSDQVLFYDFTLAARNVDRTRPVRVSLVAPQKAVIRLDFESC